MAEYSAAAGASGLVAGALAGAAAGAPIGGIGAIPGAIIGGVVGAFGGFGGGGADTHGAMTTYRRAAVAYGLVPSGKQSLEAAKLLLVHRDPRATQMALSLGVNVPRVIENYTKELQKAAAKAAKAAAKGKTPKIVSNPALSVTPWVDNSNSWQAPDEDPYFSDPNRLQLLGASQVSNSAPIPTQQQQLALLLLIVLLGGR